MGTSLQEIYGQYSKKKPLLRKTLDLEQIRLCEKWTNFGLLKKIKTSGLVAFVPTFTKVALSKMELVEISKLSRLRMVAGIEKRYSKVVHRNIIKEWVGIGWIELAYATNADYFIHPVVV